MNRKAGPGDVTRRRAAEYGRRGPGPGGMGSGAGGGTGRRRARTALLATVLAAGSALAACDQELRPLPFDPDESRVVTRTADPGAETVLSTAGRISVTVPAGAVAAPTALTLTPQPEVTSLDGLAAGRLVEGSAFRLDPVGLTLDRPARIKLSVDAAALAAGRAAARRSFWGAAAIGAATLPGVTLPVLAVAIDGRLALDPLTHVAGLPVGIGVTAEATVLGSSGVVVVPGIEPAAGASFAAVAAGGPIPSGATYAIACGNAPDGGNDCLEGEPAVAVRVDALFVERFGGALALITPEVDGTLTFHEDGTVSGSLRYAAVLRVELGSGAVGTPVEGGIATGGDETPARVPFTVAGNALEVDGRTLFYTARGDVLELALPPAVIVIENNDGSTEESRIELQLVLRRP